MIAYSQYAKIKDNYCICYFGYADEYLIQLRLLKPILEREFKGLNIFLGCRDDKSNLLDNKSLKLSELKLKKREFAHIRELRCDGQEHPVEQLLQECGIEEYTVSTKAESPTRKCVIVTKGTFPTRNLTKTEIRYLCHLAEKEGYKISIDEDIKGAGWVMGTESAPLFEAAGQGIRTTLYKSGVGNRLYKNMFPFGVIVHR